MNKKIKILIIFVAVFFLCGCSIDYKLTINKDFSVKEEFVISESRLAVGSALGDLSIEEEQKQSNQLVTKKISEFVKKYNYSIYKSENDDEYYKTRFTKTYSSITNLNNSNLLKDSFNTFVIKKDDQYIDGNINKMNAVTKGHLSVVRAEITSYYPITNSNATYCNKNKTVCTWAFVGTEKPFINFKIDISKEDPVDNIPTPVPNPDSISKPNTVLLILLFLGIGIFIIVGVMMLISKKNKNNSI